MALLEATYDSKETIPEAYAVLYSERDGRWELTEVEGIKTQSDIDRLNETNRKVRDDLKKAKDSLKGFGNKTPEEIAADLDELEELRSLRSDADDSTLEERVERAAEKRLKSKVGPLTRENERLKRQFGELEGERDNLSGEIRDIKITGEMQRAAATLGVRSTAIDDVLMYGPKLFELDDEGTPRTRDGVGVTPGLAVGEWFKERKADRPHWFEPSNGAGSQGSRTGTGSTGTDFDKMTPAQKMEYAVTQGG